MLRRTKSLVGLDIGSSAVKAVELTTTGPLHKVLAYDREPLPQGVVVAGHIADPPVVSQAIRRLFDRLPSRNRRVAAALPASAVVVKRITVATMSEEELAASLVWEAEQHVRLEPDEMNVDYKLLESDDAASTDTMSLLLVAATKEAVARVARVISDAGGTPVILDAAPFALQNVHEANYGTARGGVVALIDAGASSTTINILRGDQPLVTRQIPNTSDLPSLFHKAFAIADGKAAFGHIDEIVLSGGASLASGFAELLHERFNAPVTRLDPFRRIQFETAVTGEDASELEAVFAIAVGLALRRTGDRWSA